MFFVTHCLYADALSRMEGGGRLNVKPNTVAFNLHVYCYEHNSCYSVLVPLLAVVSSMLGIAETQTHVEWK